MNDNEDGLLPEHVKTDAYLRAAHKHLTEGLAAELNLEDGLAAILHNDSSPSGQTPASEPAEQPIAIVLISLRTRARACADALDSVLLPALDLSRALDNAINHARIHDLIRAGEVALDLAAALDRARDLASALTLALARVPGLALDLDRAVYLAADISRACRLAHALALDLDPARPRNLVRTRDLADDLARALSRPRDLPRDLNRVPVDAAGVDLSSIDLKDLDVLRGVTWTSQTIWPADVADWVRVNSVEIGEGLYEVRPGGGTARDLSMAVDGA